MASLRKPKLRKLPKRPKKSASLEVWKRYEARAKDVVKINDEKVSDYNKKKTAKLNVQNTINRISSIGKTSKKFK